MVTARLAQNADVQELCTIEFENVEVSKATLRKELTATKKELVSAKEQLATLYSQIGQLYHNSSHTSLFFMVFARSSIMSRYPMRLLLRAPDLRPAVQVRGVRQRRLLQRLRREKHGRRRCNLDARRDAQAQSHRRSARPFLLIESFQRENQRNHHSFKKHADICLADASNRANRCKFFALDVCFRARPSCRDRSLRR